MRARRAKDVAGVPTVLVITSLFVALLVLTGFTTEPAWSSSTPAAMEKKVPENSATAQNVPIAPSAQKDSVEELPQYPLSETNNIPLFHKMVLSMVLTMAISAILALVLVWEIANVKSILKGLRNPYPPAVEKEEPSIFDNNFQASEVRQNLTALEGKYEDCRRTLVQMEGLLDTLVKEVRNLAERPQPTNAPPVSVPPAVAIRAENDGRDRKPQLIEPPLQVTLELRETQSDQIVFHRVRGDDATVSFQAGAYHNASLAEKFISDYHVRGFQRVVTSSGSQSVIEEAPHAEEADFWGIPLNEPARRETDWVVFASRRSYQKQASQSSEGGHEFRKHLEGLFDLRVGNKWTIRAALMTQRGENPVRLVVKEPGITEVNASVLGG